MLPNTSSAQNNVEKQYQSLCESWRVELEEKQRHLEAAKAQILGPRCKVEAIYIQGKKVTCTTNVVHPRHVRLMPYVLHTFDSLSLFSSMLP